MRFTAILLILSTLVFLPQCKKKVDAEEEMASAPKQDDPLQNKGIGPVKSVTLGPLDAGMAAKGQKIYETKCSACHKMDEDVVGPALRDVTKRRSPEWIMNMIVNTNEMVEKDPIAKRMVAQTFQKMTFQDVDEPGARSILEYFRQVDGVQ